MPPAVLFLHHNAFASDRHVCSAENCSHKQNRKNNAKNHHSILTFSYLCRNWDQTQITFHSRHLPKSETTPSDTCRIRSAVWAILWLCVIITMVCSYSREASFSRAITSLVFCVSRLPVGSSARISAGRFRRGRAIFLPVVPDRQNVFRYIPSYPKHFGSTFPM